LNTLGDTVSIATTKDGVRFSVTGELGTGNISLKPTDAADAKVIPSYAKCV
jgi:proliferating cell nuclear antigen